MERKKKFTEASIINKDYIKLFAEIKQCGMRAWDKRSEKKKKKKPVIFIEHTQYSSYMVLDFKNLYKYLIKLLGGDKRRKIDFVDAINNSGVSWTTFRQGQSRNISSDNVKTGLEAAAEFFNIALIELLANFLVDCEDDGNKVRLTAHAQYEEIIKSFIRKAPELVRALETDSAQTSKQEIQNQPPKQVVPANRQGIERVQGAEKWLDPYNFDELPFVGRKKEIELLDNFIKSDGQFKIWAITGPSGSGKTRLACQWAYESKVLENWDCRVLHKEDRTDLEKWASWTPDKPTLIIIDYLYGFEKVVLELMRHRLEPTDSKVRLLLLDHVFPKPLHSDKRWGFSGDGSSLNHNEKYFFDLEPLDLAKKSDQTRESDQVEVIRSIIAHRAGIDKTNPQIEKAHDYLLGMEDQKAYHPLFAALVGDAIRSNKDFSAWNRRELINYYLSGEKRLPWEHKDLGLHGRWASHFIAIATARRGIRYSDLIEATENCLFAPEYLDNVQEICQKVIADNDETTLAPFEPDILGESFFLNFLQFIKKPVNIKFKNEFQHVLTAGNEDTQTEDAVVFIEFIQRLTRNLLNDDQSQEETQELWNTLFDFMCPSQFENAEPISWSVTAAIIDIVDEIQDQFPEERLLTLLSRANPAVFYQVHNSSLLETSVLCSMCWFELTSKLTKVRPKFSEEMFALFDRYTQYNKYGETPFILASAYGFCEIINAFIDHGADIEATTFVGHTALIYACASSQIEVVKLLLDEGADIHASDNVGSTALHWASGIGHAEVVRLLLDKGADIHATYIDNMAPHSVADIHATYIDNMAPHSVCSDDRVDVVKLLLDKGPDIHAIYTKGNTALRWASCSGHVDVVKMLLDKGAAIHDTDNEGCTALHWASRNGHAEVVRLLLDKGAYIHATDNKGLTALHRASSNEHVEVVKLLLNEGAVIHASDE